MIRLLPQQFWTAVASEARRRFQIRRLLHLASHAKALSPLRSASAVHEIHHFNAQPFIPRFVL
jgi:hypothetical protein